MVNIGCFLCPGIVQVVGFQRVNTRNPLVYFKVKYKHFWLQQWPRDPEIKYLTTP